MPEEMLVGLCVIPLVAIPFVFFAFLRYMRYRETVLLAEKGLIHAAHLHNGRDTLRWGIVVTALGIALTCGLYPIGLTGAGHEFPFGFGPWMLAGLLPTAVGLALILIYRLTREPADHGGGLGSPAARTRGADLEAEAGDGPDAAAPSFDDPARD